MRIRSGSTVDRRLRERPTATAAKRPETLAVMSFSTPTVYYRIGDLITTRAIEYHERLSSQSR